MNECFNDTMTGNNFSSNSPSKFSAVPGYDLCTGLGSPSGSTLINALAFPQFNYPRSVAVDGSGNLYIADTQSNTIRKITPTGMVTILAGCPQVSGTSNGTESAALFNTPEGVAVDAVGNVYVADGGNHTIRKVTQAGVVTTFAGKPGVTGGTDGTGSAARFNSPNGIAVDANGNVYIGDTGNHTIRKITQAGVVTTIAGKAGVSGTADGTGSAARFNLPRGVTVDSNGNIYVANCGNNDIRKITPSGVVTTFAGIAGAGWGSVDGTGSAAKFFSPWGITVDANSNVYVADSGNSTIRKITPSQVVTTFAGSAGVNGTADGIGSAALFNGAMGVAIDAAGNIYVADTYNYTIRKITSQGVVTTLAGTPGVWGYSN